VHTFHLCNSKYKKYFTYLREGGVVGDDGVRRGGREGGGREGEREEGREGGEGTGGKGGREGQGEGRKGGTGGKGGEAGGVVWCGVMEGGTVVGTHLVSSNQRRTTNAVRRLVVLICGRSSSYAGVRCRTWAAVFVFVRGRVVSIRGQPFSYTGVLFSYAGVSWGQGSCLRTWVVVFGSYDGGGVSWLRRQAIIEQVGLVTWRCHVGVVVVRVLTWVWAWLVTVVGSGRRCWAVDKGGVPWAMWRGCRTGRSSWGDDGS
jgi:hypothetical protein